MKVKALVTQLTGLVTHEFNGTGDTVDWTGDTVNNGFLCVFKKKLNNICASIVFKAKTKENYEEEKKV